MTTTEENVKMIKRERRKMKRPKQEEDREANDTLLGLEMIVIVKLVERRQWKSEWHHGRPDDLHVQTKNLTFGAKAGERL